MYYHSLSFEIGDIVYVNKDTGKEYYVGPGEIVAGGVFGDGEAYLIQTTDGYNVVAWGVDLDLVIPK